MSASKSDWHSLSSEEVFKYLDSSPQGLSTAEADKRLEAFGYNVIPEERRAGPLFKFLRQFHDPLIYVLLGAGAITIFLQDYIDSAIIFAVVMVNATIGFLQERSAEETIKELKKIVEIKTSVIRKNPIVIPAKELVPGDVITLEAGMKVPADARVFHSKSVRVDESLLTGESVPVNKFSDPIPEESVNKNNMIFAGTLITAGDGKAVVVATGENSQLGKITETVKQEGKVETPLLKRVRKLGLFLLIAIIFISAINFAIGIYRGYELVFAFLASVALMVAAVPESLPALITMTLASGVRDMASKKAVIRRLPAVETLGSVTTICTDKTGTLTQNKIKVVKVFTEEKEYQMDELKGQDHLEILRAGYICNKAVYKVLDGEYVVSGDPTEVALLESASHADIEEEFNVVDEIPFDPGQRFMATAISHNSDAKLYVKGSPEKVLSMCRYVLNNGSIEEIDVEYYSNVAAGYAQEGYRILGFASKSLKANFGKIGDQLEEMVFLGFQCMIDPPREGVFEAIKNCKRAGVRVIMITGDHPSTALAIAQQLGIEGYDITGEELERMSDEELTKALQSTGIFARTLPQQKHRIVKALQANGEVVAVTGDGVNDAPALKAADIGVAMGSGTEVAKEASETIILDDNFATIVDSIEEGRNVFRKIQKVIAWTLPTNGGEASIILAAFLIGLTLPILPVHILWINTVTAVLLGTTLVFEQKEPKLLRAKPTKGGLVTRSIGFRIFWVSALMAISAYAFFFRYEDLGMARTATMNVIVFFEIFYLLTSRSLNMSFLQILKLRNKVIIPGIALTILLQLAAVYLFPLNSILQLSPLPPVGWLEIALIASSVFFLSEIEKAYSSR
ncbi:MAG: cation-translocating P-type ATPase [Candidatus Hadarchaeota archaeon]